jgi:predicted methyltransferase MtxX (methanogen marker protein 4)
MELAEEVAEARQSRLELERDKATLEIEVVHARKLEALLVEERQSRANAQMRASTAEAKLAQMEGERSARDSKNRGRFWSKG